MTRVESYAILATGLFAPRSSFLFCHPISRTTAMAQNSGPPPGYPQQGPSNNQPAPFQQPQDGKDEKGYSGALQGLQNCPQCTHVLMYSHNSRLRVSCNTQVPHWADNL